MNAQNTLRPEVANRIAYIKTELVNLRTQHQELIKTDRNKAENIFDIITDFEFEMQALATGSIEGVKNLISNVVVNESLRGYQNALTFLQKLQAQPEATAQETSEEAQMETTPEASPKYSAPIEMHISWRKIHEQYEYRVKKHYGTHGASDSILWLKDLYTRLCGGKCKNIKASKGAIKAIQDDIDYMHTQDSVKIYDEWRRTSISDNMPPAPQIAELFNKLFGKKLLKPPKEKPKTKQYQIILQSTTNPAHFSTYKIFDSEADMLAEYDRMVQGKADNTMQMGGTTFKIEMRQIFV